MKYLPFKMASIAPYFRIVGIFLVLGISFSHKLSASVLPQDFSTMCDRSASFAALKTGVPISVLQAISLNETGRRRGGRLRPWPWTVNMEGKGMWFQSEDAAKAFVYKNYKRGARSFDIGCFQINFKWHGRAFASIDDMFDPDLNALYAARLLLDLYREKGNWGEAAGAYHSRTVKFAKKYQKRFESILATLDVPDARWSPPTLQASNLTSRRTARVRRINRYPLLQVGAAQNRLGSLVPANVNQPVVRVIGQVPENG